MYTTLLKIYKVYAADEKKEMNKKSQWGKERENLKSRGKGSGVKQRIRQKKKNKYMIHLERRGK